MEGLTTIESQFTPEETIKRLEAEIEAQGMRIFTRVDHSRLAAEVGLKLPPTTLILFGNPRSGTPLMMANQTIGIDLPLKALVWQDALGKTWLSCNELSWLAKRHELNGADRVAGMMDLALAAIAEKVTQAFVSCNSRAGRPPCASARRPLRTPPGTFIQHTSK